MNQSLQRLMLAIAREDMYNIKNNAIDILKADKSQKNSSLREQLIKNLTEQQELKSLPTNISKYLTVEDVSMTFIPERYYLPYNESYVLEDILKTNKVTQQLTEKRIRYVNSTLLHGESGTGKTTFGRYIAYTLNLPFVYINFATLISSLLGDTGKRIDLIFNFVKNQRCVFMIDELDAIATKRGANDTSEINRIAITLMQALDKLQNGVILIGATNRLKIIDEAIVRRFNRVHLVDSLSVSESCEFAKQYLTDCGYIEDFPTDDSVYALVNHHTKPSEIEKRIIDYIINAEIKKQSNEETKEEKYEK